MVLGSEVQSTHNMKLGQMAALYEKRKTKPKVGGLRFSIEFCSIRRQRENHKAEGCVVFVIACLCVFFVCMSLLFVFCLFSNVKKTQLFLMKTLKNQW